MFPFILVEIVCKDCKIKRHGFVCATDLSHRETLNLNQPESVCVCVSVCAVEMEMCHKSSLRISRRPTSKYRVLSFYFTLCIKKTAHHFQL